MLKFLKMPAIEFDTFNNAATVKYIEQTSDKSCEQYTILKPDKDANFVWAVVAHDYITDKATVSLDEAIRQGMIEFAEVV